MHHEGPLPGWNSIEGDVVQAVIVMTACRCAERSQPNVPERADSRGPGGIGDEIDDRSRLHLPIGGLEGVLECVLVYEVHWQARSHHVKIGTVVAKKKSLPAAPILEEAGLLPTITSRSAVTDDDGRPDNEVWDTAFRDTPFGDAFRPRILSWIARGFSVQALSDRTRYIS